MKFIVKGYILCWIFLGFKLKKFRPTRCKLIRRGKINLKRGEGGNNRNAQYISLTIFSKVLINYFIYYLSCNVLNPFIYKVIYDK